MIYWICKGSVRGTCGVKHKTEKASQKHCEKDDRDCKRGNGENSYSDRQPVMRATEARSPISPSLAHHRQARGGAK